MATADSVVRWERVNCDLCQSSEYEKELDGVDWEFGLADPLSLVRCKQCGLIYLNPRPAPASMRLIYPATYNFYSLPDPPGVPFLRKLANPHTFIRNVARRWGRWAYRRWRFHRYTYLDGMTPGRILDVGCATGRSVHPYYDGSLYDLKRIGWEVHGCEIDEQAAEIARASGVEVRTGCLSEINYRDQRFDVIRFNHVLEHSRSPMTDLAMAAKLLTADGRLIVSGPNIQSAAYALFGRQWSGLDLPRHFYHFTPTILRKYCEKLALQVHRECFDSCCDDLVHSLRHFLQSDSVGDLNEPCSQVNRISQVFGLGSRWHLSRAAKTLASHFNHLALGDNYTLIAKPSA